MGIPTNDASHRASLGSTGRIEQSQSPEKKEETQTTKGSAGASLNGNGFTATMQDFSQSAKRLSRIFSGNLNLNEHEGEVPTDRDAKPLNPEARPTPGRATLSNTIGPSSLKERMAPGHASLRESMFITPEKKPIDLNSSRSLSRTAGTKVKKELEQEGPPTVRLPTTARGGTLGRNVGKIIQIKTKDTEPENTKTSAESTDKAKGSLTEEKPDAKKKSSLLNKISSTFSFITKPKDSKEPTGPLLEPINSTSDPRSTQLLLATTDKGKAKSMATQDKEIGKKTEKLLAKLENKDKSINTGNLAELVHINSSAAGKFVLSLTKDQMGEVVKGLKPEDRTQLLKGCLSEGQKIEKPDVFLRGTDGSTGAFVAVYQRHLLSTPAMKEKMDQVIQNNVLTNSNLIENLKGSNPQEAQQKFIQSASQIFQEVSDIVLKDDSKELKSLYNLVSDSYKESIISDYKTKTELQKKEGVKDSNKTVLQVEKRVGEKLTDLKDAQAIAERVAGEMPAKFLFLTFANPILIDPTRIDSKQTLDKNQRSAGTGFGIILQNLINGGGDEGRFNPDGQMHHLNFARTDTNFKKQIEDDTNKLNKFLLSH